VWTFDKRHSLTNRRLDGEKVIGYSSKNDVHDCSVMFANTPVAKAAETINVNVLRFLKLLSGVTVFFNFSNFLKTKNANLITLRIMRS